ncbi:unnamed protein product [Ectocarpus sp. 12 AP-2014]
MTYDTTAARHTKYKRGLQYKMTYKGDWFGAGFGARTRRNVPKGKNARRGAQTPKRRHNSTTNHDKNRKPFVNAEARGAGDSPAQRTKVVERGGVDSTRVAGTDRSRASLRNTRKLPIKA